MLFSRIYSGKMLKMPQPFLKYELTYIEIASEGSVDLQNLRIY